MHFGKIDLVEIIIAAVIANSANTTVIMIYINSIDAVRKLSFGSFTKFIEIANVVVEYSITKPAIIFSECYYYHFYRNLEQLK